jgi:hypothetical protein
MRLSRRQILRATRSTCTIQGGLSYSFQIPLNAEVRVKKEYSIFLSSRGNGEMMSSQSETVNNPTTVQKIP